MRNSRKIKILLSTFALLATLSATAVSGPFTVIIVTENSTDSERGYTEFLQDIYKGNVDVRIDPDRYDEDLSDNKKLELVSADLIIVSRDADGRDYNADSEFWSELNVPILSHNIKLARSDGHHYWDWLHGDSASTSPLTHLAVSDASDEIFVGVDTSSGTVEIFTAGKDIDHSDQASAGNGTVVATTDGNVAIARWLGGEASYYDGSDYAPHAPRVFFAMPTMTSEFFDDATEQAKLMLENTILSLLPINRPQADIDLDGDVDFDDFAAFSRYWMGSECTETSPCGRAHLANGPNIMPDDLLVFAENWLKGIDVIPPEPNVMTWQTEPSTVSTESIYMAATVALDVENGIEYYFQCTSGNAPDSGWQYSNVFEPNGLAQGTKYTYTTKARDTSSNLNETEWSTPAAARTFEVYWQIADASAAAPIDANLFIVGDDEGSKLRIYDSGNPDSAPLADPNIWQFLNIDPAQPETDIEGATWFNGRIFWITSHGRNKDGKYWFSRYQFFATTVTIDGNDIGLTVDGNYTNLVDDLIAYDLDYNLGLADAIGVAAGHIDPNEIPELAPKRRGLNIEALCTSVDGNSMYIGFRNPRPKPDDTKLALIIQLNNPQQVVLSGASPDFEPPLLLDLDGFGIRSMEYSFTLGQYLLVAGSHKSGLEKPLQILYAYDMLTGILTPLDEFETITPEALFQFPDSNDVQLLSDDGTLLVDTAGGPVQNKFLPWQQRTFRAHRVTP